MISQSPRSRLHHLVLYPRPLKMPNSVVGSITELKPVKISAASLYGEAADFYRFVGS